MKEQAERTLTDADVKAITDCLEQRITDKFTRGAGIGVLRLAWKGIVLAIIALAIYGYTHGGAR